MQNELTQKMTLQVYCHYMCPLKIKWQVKPLKKNDDWKTKGFENNKKNKQKGKVGTTSLLLPKVFRGWPYVRCCWKCL